MFFTWAVKTRYRWLQKTIYWMQVPILAVSGYGAMWALSALLEPVLSRIGSPFWSETLALLSQVIVFAVAAALCIYWLDRLFHYRAGDLLLGSLARCPEDVSTPLLTLKRGAVVVELRMGEFYNFAKYWPMRLTSRELAPFVFLDTYEGVLNLIEQVNDGTAPINEMTPLMTTTIFLRALSQIPTGVVTEEIPREKTLVYRLAMALSLRMNPFSSRLPAPTSGSRRAYLLTKSLVDSESFFREEVARLTNLTERILRRKHDPSRD